MRLANHLTDTEVRNSDDATRAELVRLKEESKIRQEKHSALGDVLLSARIPVSKRNRCLVTHKHR
jgi:hypothetical protein